MGIEILFPALSAPYNNVESQYMPKPRTKRPFATVQSCAYSDGASSNAFINLVPNVSVSPKKVHEGVVGWSCKTVPERPPSSRMAL